MSELDKLVEEGQEPESEETGNNDDLTQEQINDLTFNDIMESAGGVVGGEESVEKKSPEPEETTEESSEVATEEEAKREHDSLELLKRTQRKHQELIASLKTQHPNVYNQYYNPPIDPVVPEKEEQPLGDYVLDDEELLTPSKMVKILEARERQQEMKRHQESVHAQQVQLSGEIEQANSVMTQCANDLGLTPEEYSSAVSFAGQYVRADRPGDPAKFVDLAYKQMLDISRSKIQNKQITKTQADVERKMKTAMLVKQPVSGTPPLQRELTAKEKLIKVMQKAGGGSADKDIFG